MVLAILAALGIGGMFVFGPKSPPPEKKLRSVDHDFRVDAVVGGKFARLELTDMATGFAYRVPYCEWVRKGDVLHLKEETWKDLPEDGGSSQSLDVSGVRMQVGGIRQACDALMPPQYPSP